MLGMLEIKEVPCKWGNWGQRDRLDLIDRVPAFTRKWAGLYTSACATTFNSQEDAKLLIKHRVIDLRKLFREKP